jgi:zinc protease
MRTLTKNLDRAAELLRLAVNSPRFDEEPFERVREHMNARLRHDANDPGTLASRNWKAKSFPDHPYGQPADGTLETLARIERGDLVKAAKRGIARDQLLIAVVGAIDEKDAAALVDKAFADLPAKSELKPIPDAVFAGLGAVERIDLDVPQSTIRFGRPALKRDDPDFIPAIVAAHVLGGSGSMTSRLFREVREKRGLAYTVFGTFYSLERGAYFYGGTTTKNERARESFDVASAEIRDVALNGLNEEELEKGKTYLIGSYPLRFDTSAKIASQLVHIQLERRAPEWLVERNREIGAVTMASVKRAAHRAFGDGSLHTTVVGRPEGF